MDPIVPQLRRSYFVRMGIVTALFVLIGLPMLLLSKGRPWAYHAVGIVPTCIWLYILLSEYFRGASRLDDTGATRRDGKRFEWTDFKTAKFVNVRLKSGQVGALNHVDLLFSRGRVRIFPFTLENAGEVMQFVERFRKFASQEEKPPVSEPAKQEPAKVPPVVEQPAASAQVAEISVDLASSSESVADAAVPAEPALNPESAPVSPVSALTPGAPCSVCSTLGEYQRGFQKRGREDEDTFLPPAAGRLKAVGETRPGHNRSPEVERCPECGAWFLSCVEYDYLATGSEDTQTLTRITPEEAEKLLKGEG